MHLYIPILVMLFFLSLMRNTPNLNLVCKDKMASSLQKKGENLFSSPFFRARFSELPITLIIRRLWVVTPCFVFSDAFVASLSPRPLQPAVLPERVFFQETPVGIMPD